MAKAMICVTELGLQIAKFKMFTHGKEIL